MSENTNMAAIVNDRYHVCFLKTSDASEVE